MPWNKCALLLAIVAAACSPDEQKAAQAGKAPPVQARPIGHQPKPMMTATAPGPLLFHGYPCGDDCIGHQEGYSWASAHKISDPADCHGTSETFIEGCKAFAGIEGPFGGRYIDPSFPHMIGTD